MVYGKYSLHWMVLEETYRGDLERESKPLTAEGVVSFKTELRVKKNGSHF